MPEPDGGQGPPYAASPKSVIRACAAWGRLAPLPKNVMLGGNPTTIQWDHSFGFTVRSIAVMAKLFVPAGAPLHDSAGDTFWPPQRVYTCSLAIIAPS